MRIMIIIMGFILFMLLADAGDWPQWRGPQRDGASTEKDWNTNWPKEGPKKLWEVEVGNGNSSPVIVGNRGYTWGMFRLAEQLAPDSRKDNRRQRRPRVSMGLLTVLCLDAGTGTRIWEYSYQGIRANGYGHTNSTPVVDKDRVYIYSHDCRLFCLDAESGEEIWSQRLKQNKKGPSYGYAASPAVHDGRVIVPLSMENEKGLRLVAYNTSDGKQAWQSEQFIMSSRYFGWGSPVIGKLNGKPTVVYATGMVVAGVDPANGKTLWTYDFPDRGQYPQDIQGNASAVTPSIEGDLVFVPYYKDHKSGFSVCLSLKSGSPQLAWTTDAFFNWFQSCVMWDGLLYAIGEAPNPGRASKKRYGSKCGSLYCVDVTKGTILWSVTALKDVNGGPGIETFNASFMIADGKIILWSSEGDLVIAEVSAKGCKTLAAAKVLDRVSIRYPIPILANGRIFCRDTKGTLVCLDVK